METWSVIINFAIEDRKFYCSCFPVREHFVATTDGYIVSVLQLVNNEIPLTARKNESVLMYHGLTANANTFTALANNSIACLTAYKGTLLNYNVIPLPNF